VAPQVLLGIGKRVIKMDSVHCSQRHEDVPLETCLEKCITNQCRDQDQIDKLQIEKLAQELRHYNVFSNYPPRELQEQSFNVIKRLMRERGLDKFKRFKRPKFNQSLGDENNLLRFLLESWVNGWNIVESISEVEGGADEPLTKCPDCETTLEPHKRLRELLVCPKCWHKFDYNDAYKGKATRVYADKPPVKKSHIGKGLDKTAAEPDEAYITISAQKPAGIWKKTWYTVTPAYDGWAGGLPSTENPKEIPALVDKAKQIIIQRFEQKFKMTGSPPKLKIEIIWHKESPELEWHEKEEGEVEWRKVFRV